MPIYRLRITIQVAPWQNPLPKPGMTPAYALFAGSLLHEPDSLPVNTAPQVDRVNAGMEAADIEALLVQPFAGRK